MMDLDLSAAWATLQGMLQGFVSRLPYVGIALVVLALSLWLGRGVRLLVARLAERRRGHRNLAVVLGKLGQTVAVVIGSLVALVVVLPGFRPGQLIELLGIGSVAIGFAFRDILQNFLAGILILLSEPFRIGDQIVVGEHEGTVEDVQTRATVIRTYDGRRVVIPNGSIFTQSVVVNTVFEKRRIEYDLAIGPDDDIDETKALVRATLGRLDGMEKDPAPDVLAREASAAGATLRVRWWITPPRHADALDSRDQVLAAIAKALARAKQPRDAAAG